MAVIQSPTVPGQLAEVDASGQLKVVLPVTGALATAVRLTDRDNAFAQFSDHGRQKVGQESLLFYDPIDGAVVNTNLWVQSISGLTQTVASGFQVMNGGAATTINSYTIATSIRTLPFLSHFPLYLHLKAKTPNTPQANATIELGFGTAATTAAPTDGAFFRWASDGTFVCILNNGGVETSSGALTAPSVNVTHTFAIFYTHNSCRFEIDSVVVATVSPPTGSASNTALTRLPAFCRVYTGGSVPAVAPQLHFTEFSVAQMDINWGKTWPEQMVGVARGAYQSPVTTFLQSANHANSTSPASATLSNTAAGYTTLGGRYQFAAPAGAATDFALFGFQVPAGYNLVVEGIRISAINTGAVVATTATILDWGIATNSSAVSLATAEVAGTAWAPRRTPLGTMGFIIGAAIGQSAESMDINFSSPVICEGGRFFHVIVQVPVGTATASQVIRGDVMINGYFE